MKEKIKELIIAAANKAYATGHLSSADFPEVMIEEPKREFQGDYSSNFAMIMAGVQKMPPRKIAEIITDHIEHENSIFSKVEIAGPGFINFFICDSEWHAVLNEIDKQDVNYGSCNIGKGKRLQVEFVSANPTGPLHVGHGRGAAIGDSMANILRCCGYNVEKEYYINDSGRQIQTLGRSVFLRYKALFSDDINFPDDCYQGEYIIGLASDIKTEMGRDLLDIEEETAISYCADVASKKILDGIQKDLASFGVSFDNWFSEQRLFDSGKVDEVIDRFKKNNYIYEKDKALWFRTTDFGDEKDRVVVRSNGHTTYFAADIAYHQEKLDRGYEKIIDVWGADHHGYIPRIKASIQASGKNDTMFSVILVQLVNLLREGEPVAMSTRSGEFVTLSDVIKEVGSDAARFIFLTRHYESPLDFDLALAKKKTNENPVYYVQYVHARISSIIEKAKKTGIDTITWDDKAIDSLVQPEETRLIKILGSYPEVVELSARYMEPHRITFYLMQLASGFHSYYNMHRVLTDDALLTSGRLCLITAVKKIIRNGLCLLGVSAPEKM
jgi:arginyl-tRNA synthetase